MEAFFSPSRERTQRNDAFQSWLIETCTDSRMPEKKRAHATVG
jgi:hypothetical protein